MSRKMSRKSSIEREGRMVVRASADLYRAAFDAAGAAMGAHSVIAHRTTLLAAAALGLRPADHPEVSRMAVEKLEAAVAAGPAVVSYWAGVQMQLARVWLQEVQAAARLIGWTSAPGPRAVAELLESAAARSRAAALGMLVAHNTAMVPVVGPYYGRIRRNARRLARSVATSASGTNTAARRRRG